MVTTPETLQILDKLRGDTIGELPRIEFSTIRWGVGWLILLHAANYLEFGDIGLKMYRFMHGSVTLRYLYPGLKQKIESKIINK